MSVAENFQAIRDELGDKIILVAVTKNHGVEVMREAIDAGATDIGENRVQEAAEKFQTLDRKVTRHLIGHLQTNKAKAAVKLFDLIQSVDSQHLAAALDKAAASIGKVQDVLIQVNAAREPQKSGVMLEDLDGLIKFVDAAKNLRLRGLMMIAPNLEDVNECRPFFKQMRELFDGLKTNREAFDFLSMGMTHDYKIAVEEGANVVRVGTAIFGERSYR
ncbi:MAG: YggS family pyridoxal phosphate-dependent enzyme [Selenomonadaceae bacterium]|nr:YggS family pyridoxal phosphate-dependent enzyme [Selenomonadaceae bacterium]MBR0103374.1 YggS family pyridoxal phosphate-dependent enzyme [Selenomonadaceae bacterium]